MAELQLATLQPLTEACQLERNQLIEHLTSDRVIGHHAHAPEQGRLEVLRQLRTDGQFQILGRRPLPGAAETQPRARGRSDRTPARGGHDGGQNIGAQSARQHVMAPAARILVKPPFSET